MSVHKVDLGQCARKTVPHNRDTHYRLLYDALSVEEGQPVGPVGVLLLATEMPVEAAATHVLKVFDYACQCRRACIHA